MLSTKTFISIFFLSYFCFIPQPFPEGTTYITPSFKSIPKHSVDIQKNNIIITIFSKDMFYRGNEIKFKSEIKGDTIYILNKIKNSKKNGGIKINNEKLISFFTNTRFFIKSKNTLIHTESNRPYFNKKLVGSTLSNQTVYSINGKILMSTKDSSVLNPILNEKKFKIKTLEVIKPENAIKTYGVLGFKGIIKIKGKFKKCK